MKWAIGEGRIGKKASKGRKWQEMTERGGKLWNEV